MTERELDAVEDALKLDLQRVRPKSKDRDEEFYPQFDEAVRHEASSMAQHYEIFTVWKNRSEH